MLNRLANVLNLIMIRVSARHLSWMSLARAIVVIQIVVLCSSAVRAAEFNFGFDGAPRPSQEAILIVKEFDDIRKNWLGISLVMDRWVPRVFSVDGKVVDKVGNQLSSPWLFGPRSHCDSDCVIRLLPGVHSVEVNYWSSGTRGAHNQVVSFTAKPGKKYKVFLAFAPGQWSAIIREVFE